MRLHKGIAAAGVCLMVLWGWGSVTVSQGWLWGAGFLALGVASVIQYLAATAAQRQT